MSRPAPPKAKEVEQVLQIARALEAEGYMAGAVQVAPDGGWSVSWAKSANGQTELTPLEKWKAGLGAR